MGTEPSRRVLIRRWIIVCICLFLLLSAGAALSPRRALSPKITEEQVKSIQVGMSLAEVEAVLACQPGNYTSRDYLLPVDMRFFFVEREKKAATFEEWAADTPDPPYTDENGRDRQMAITIRVLFDEDGKVITICRMELAYESRQPTLLDRLKQFMPSWVIK